MLFSLNILVHAFLLDMKPDEVPMFVSPQQLVSHVCYDTIMLMQLVESVLSKVMEEFENHITSQVELDFRVVFDQELGLIFKLRGMMIGWIHDSVSELL
uniref:Uncharacterized protein n=1 Tax=Lactuca sativa TaxID=4236 RepID=A0A9R1W4D7_LACSA|nr:hypothetical protein LSAT_V11C300140290 [Lactuca sativa]